MEDEEPIVTEEQRGEKRSQDDAGKKTQMSEVLAFMKEQSEAAEKRRSEEQQKRDARHKERMDLMKDFINVLKNK